MGEENIVRTTLYLPKSLYLAVKSKDLNMSRLVRSFLEQIIEEDEEDILVREIEKKKKENAEKQYILDVATKMAEFLTLRFKQFIRHTSKEERIWAGNEFIANTIDIIQKDYGVFIEYNEMVKLFEKVDANGSRIEKEDIIPYVVRQGGTKNKNEAVRAVH